jgi:hypothetical protein
MSTVHHSNHSTETHTPIHLLDHNGKPVCGIDLKTVRRAWNVCAWPTASPWPDLCAHCWDVAHAPAVRREREVA